MRRFPWTTWAVLAVGEVLFNLWIALLCTSAVFKILHWVGVEGRGLDWVHRVVIIGVGVVTAAHMVRLVLARDQRSWAWRQLEQPHPGRRSDAV